MKPSQTNTATGAGKSEVRFAVVMYGGVSLAIYMNGIAQELLRMVRASATKDSGNLPLVPYVDLDPVEAVYRKLAFWQPGDESVWQDRMKKDEPLPRTFTIDIISGTSAGGINGIFLAKALANGQKIDGLKNLWITEGDVNLLINDSNSVRNTGLRNQAVPESLFNSRRMYQKLLNAFRGMDSLQKEANQLPEGYVDEVDLFVTATDIRGLVLPVKLADTAVYEKKHRTVFHFSRSDSGPGGTEWNDFDDHFNPMLAFAARATSSFPFAFEPMRLCDIDEVLQSLKYGTDDYAGNPDWKRFFRNYPDKAAPGSLPYVNRPFGDGGYLDNKPFSYAIDSIASKSSDYPVDRKLLYIEPVPDHPEDQCEKDGKPNAIENSMAALLTLPRYETIREDIQRVLDRNRLNDRINRIISELEEDRLELDRARSSQGAAEQKTWTEGVDPLWAKPDLSDKEWGWLDLTDMIQRKGMGYVAYQRLEIAAVTDDFGKLLTRVAGFDEDSDSYLVFRYLVRAWRKKRYFEYNSKKESGQEHTLNAFLHAYDLTFPIRRLNFLHRQIDRIYRMDDKCLVEELRRLSERFCHRAETVEFVSIEESWIVTFRESLLESKKMINEQLASLRGAGRKVRSRSEGGAVVGPEKAGVSAELVVDENIPLYEHVSGLLAELAATDEIRGMLMLKSSGVNRERGASVKNDSMEDVVEYFLDKRHESPLYDDEVSDGQSACSGEENGERKARRLFEKYTAVSDAMDSIGTHVRKRLKSAIEDSDSKCRMFFGIDGGSCDFSTQQLSVHTILGSYYRSYTNYDMVIFPIIYGTGGGEGDEIDVIRISPEDASAFIDERKDNLNKLAGRRLGNFGAFMDKRWRQNDIMWGQLDGSERIINSLIDDRDVAAKLISEAQAAIVYETIAPMGKEEAYDLLSEPFMHTTNSLADPDSLTKFLAKLKDGAAKINWTSDRRQFDVMEIDIKGIRDHYLEKFPFNKGLEPHGALKNAARATTVTSRILTGIADEYDFSGKKYLSTLTNVGRFMLWLVEAAVPRSMSNLLFSYWLQLLYLIEVLLFTGSTLFVNAPVQHFAIAAFAMTVAVHSVVSWFKSLILFRKRWGVLFRSFAIVLIVFLIVSGVLFLYLLTGFNESWWWKLHCIHFWIKAHLPVI